MIALDYKKFFCTELSPHVLTSYSAVHTNAQHQVFSGSSAFDFALCLKQRLSHVILNLVATPTSPPFCYRFLRCFQLTHDRDLLPTVWGG